MSKIALEQLKEIVAIQGEDGNWNYDSYMLGLYNGLELGLSIMENREPVYRQLPKRTLFQKLSTFLIRKFYKPRPIAEEVKS